jgi:hypothetical protein
MAHDLFVFIEQNGRGLVAKVMLTLIVADINATDDDGEDK